MFLSRWRCMSDEKRNGWHRHTNPDGSIGGWVPDSADISPEAFVGQSAFVDPGSKLAAGQRVLDGQMLTKSGEIVDLSK